ncbi:hypothetical protein HK100_006048 [Physocladia obscura]|uniref:C3H1-type domain-containing protein n=1 Tax=Physocladia obscura TaxID=109957 RepID=A0AAD5X902_9FUNG|nr:hypothetical protein HK100_006048 [Physocladia obscura]
MEKLMKSLLIHEFRIEHSVSQLSKQPQPYVERALNVQGQIVRMRFRNAVLGFIDLRLAETDHNDNNDRNNSDENKHSSKGSVKNCSCCQKITVVICADNLPDGGFDSFKKGRVKLGDEIAVSGTLVFADAVTGWVDIIRRSSVSDFCSDEIIRLLEARLVATNPCLVIRRFPGRGFQPEMAIIPPDNSTRSRQLASSSQICKFYINSNGAACPLADACPFLHPSIADIPRLRKEWLSNRVAQRMHNAELDAFPDDPTPMHAKHPHALRSRVFADWLVETFGDKLLRGPRNLLFDIAGGAGGVCLELVDRHNIDSAACIVVDSRPLKISFNVKKWMKRRDKMSRKAEEQNARVFIADEREEILDYQRENDGVYEENEDYPWTEEYEKTDNPQDSDASKLPFRYIQSVFSPDSIPFELVNAALLIGMHPDQATGAIVEVALQYNLPFAVVPCCVFQDTFNERILKSGKAVTTTLDLVEWIKEKDPKNIETKFLNFQGKNLVVYRK